jgi:hypothetical protein
VELYLHSQNTPSWRGAQLKIDQRDNLISTVLIGNDIAAQYKPSKQMAATFETNA